METLEIRNAAALDLPDIRALFEAACAHDRPVAAGVLIGELRDHLHLPQLGVLVGQEAGKFDALAILMAPSSRLFTAVTVYHFFNRGSAALRDNLITSVAQWTHSRGFGSLAAENLSGRSDTAWRKAFGAAGKIRKIGTSFAIDLMQPEKSDGSGQGRAIRLERDAEPDSRHDAG